MMHHWHCSHVGRLYANEDANDVLGVMGWLLFIGWHKSEEIKGWAINILIDAGIVRSAGCGAVRGRRAGVNPLRTILWYSMMHAVITT